MAEDLVQACNDKNIGCLKELLDVPSLREHINNVVSLSAIKRYKHTHSEITALGFACEYNDLEFMQLLLDHGASDDVVSEGWCAIHYCCYGKVDALTKVKILVERNKENINRPTTDRRFMPIIFAIEQNNPDVVKYLLESGTDVAATHEDQQTALHRASTWNKPDVIRMLLIYGASINNKDSDGETPLHKAIRFGGFNAFKALVASPDCDVTIMHEKEESNLNRLRKTKIQLSLAEYCKTNSFLDQEELEKITTCIVALKCDSKHGLQRHLDFVQLLLKRTNSNCGTDDMSFGENGVVSKVKAIQRKVQTLSNQWWPGKDDDQFITNLRREMDKINVIMRQETAVFPFEERPFFIDYSDVVIANAVLFNESYIKDTIVYSEIKEALCEHNVLTELEAKLINRESENQQKVMKMLKVLQDKKKKSWGPMFLGALSTLPSLSEVVSKINETLDDHDIRYNFLT